MIYCRRCVSMIENCISGYLYNEHFSESNREKCPTFQGLAWSLIVDENIIKNCSTALQVFSFRSLSLYLLFLLKARILLQFLSQAFSILYMFSPFCFVCISFSLKHVFLHSFTSMTQGSCRLLFEVK